MTPEGVVVEMTLAGLGSRIVAQVLDSIIKFVVILIAAVAFGVFGSVAPEPGLLFIGFLIFNAVLAIAYDVVFEVTQNGRTPGKMATGIRTVMVGGAPVTFVPSLIRNILRLIDALPTFYLIAMVSVLVTERNQRLGDLLAGTIVVHESPKAHIAAGPPSPTAVLPAVVEAWDVTAITQEELAAVTRFLERRSSLTPDARAGLAQEMAARLRPKVVGAVLEIPPEQFLVWLAQVKTARS